MAISKVKRNWWIFLSLFMISNIILGTIWGNKQFAKSYKKFNETDIHGKLMWVGDYQKGSGFQVIGNYDVFVFYPNADRKLIDYHFFDDVAKPGDEVVKHSYSDTLFLFKSDKVYKWTFK